MVTELEITDHLNRQYIGNSRYKCANIFVFKDDWESDFFLQKQNGYCYEFEVKISRADFIKDKKKKDKHSILSSGKYQQVDQRTWNENSTGIDDRWITTYKESEHDFVPNKFFYVLPEGLVTIDEIPAYAGLMIYNPDNKSTTTIKEAPFIHKRKLDFSKRLCHKFYAYWIDARSELRRAKWRIEELETDIEELKTKQK